MDIRIDTRHVQASDDLQAEIRDKIESMQRFFEKITSCHVVLDSEHADKKCEIVMSIMGATVTGKAKEETLHKAVESALEKVERQLKKNNEKIKTHKATKAALGE